jgi:ankyrin repeat protein
MVWVVTKDSVFGKGDSYSFRLAIQFGQIERVNKFIEERYSTVNLGGLLHYALSYNEFEIVRLLIKKFKCSVDCKNESGEIPLHVASRNGDRNC